MKISTEDVLHVAKLCRLKLSQVELQQFTKQLNSIIDYMSKLNELNTEGIEPTSHVLPLRNVLRKDIPSRIDESESFLSIAPEKKDQYFKVPKIIEEL